MKYKLIFGALAVLAACSTAPTTAPDASVPAARSANSSGADLNAFRAEQGLGRLRANASLTRAAQAHAADMAQRGYFAHEAPDGPNGRTFGDRARNGGCVMRSGAENLANGQRSEAEVVAAWANSPGHRRNMMVADYKLYGLGRADNYWVLLLAGGC